jgi:hypothetical protein
MRRRSPESRHHRIADKLLDRPRGPLDLRRHRIVKTIKQRPDPLRIPVSRKLRMLRSGCAEALAALRA